MSEANTLPDIADLTIQAEPLDDSSNGRKSTTRTARVVLPEAEKEEESDDENPEKDDEGTVAEDADFLEDFPDETQELELIHSRIGSLDKLRLPRFAKHLRKLCLRQNFISTLDPEMFSQLTLLEELDLYDNKIKAPADGIKNLANLQSLDLSFNLLRAIPETIGHLQSLHTVYFVQNRITKITGFESLTTLRSLELGGNKLRRIEGLESLVNLEELWLGKNKITKLENLSTLRKLKILSMQSNRVTVIENLDNLESLEELYLSHNGVKRLEGLESNLRLKTLDVGNNFIPTIENISHLQSLEELWMNGNQIPNLQDLTTQLGSITTLETLYLEANPCQSADPTGYRRKIMLALPQLKQIDATYTKL